MVVTTATGGVSVIVEEIETVDCAVAHPAHTITETEPEVGITNAPCEFAILADEQLPPENVAPVVWRTYSPEVDDKETVRVSPRT